MKKTLLLGAVLFAAPSQAATVTWDVWDWPGNDDTNVSAVLATAAGGQQVNITARLYGPVQPDALTNISQINRTTTVRRADGTSASNGGLGVTGGGSTEQVDTNNRNNREAFILESATILKLTSLKLNMIDANDTIQIYGIEDDGALTSLGFAGMISGMGGSAIQQATWTGGGAGTLTFNPVLPAYKRLVLTTREGGEETVAGMTGQGYRLASISAAVPEPASWAFMVGGFGLLGASARRSRRTNVVYA